MIRNSDLTLQMKLIDTCRKVEEKIMQKRYFTIVHVESVSDCENQTIQISPIEVLHFFTIMIVF